MFAYHKKRRKTKSQTIIQFMRESYNMWRLYNYKIYYIINNTNIIAYCLINDDIINKIITFL